MAANPKFKKADALNRTGCKEGPGPEGKDPRITNPALSRLITCRNMTMAQFAEQLQTLAPDYFYYPVLDATGIEGAWDFTLSFSKLAQFRGPVPVPGTEATPDPNGAIPLPAAMERQLGLKLELKKRPERVLVIDRIRQKPGDN